MLWIPGADVSEYQGLISWSRFKASGIRFVYIRYCMNEEIDVYADRNARMCRLFGIPFGFYCYFRPKGNAVAQANLLIDATRHYGATLIPMIDVEAADGFAPWRIRQKLTRAVAAITTAFGKPPAIYTGDWFWDTYVLSNKFLECPLWVAQYVHYNREVFADLAHSIPVNPEYWDTYALSHRRPVQVGGWKTCQAWQFAGGMDGVGRRYGMQSLDLDLNIVKAAAFNRFLL